MKLWKKLILGVFALGVLLSVLLVILVAVLLVPPASKRTVTSIVVTFSHTGPMLNADPEDDLFIYVEEYASPFRINRAVEAGFLGKQFMADVLPGEQIEILAFQRYLPRDPKNEVFLGSIPTWTVLQDDAAYILDRLPEHLSMNRLLYGR